MMRRRALLGVPLLFGASAQTALGQRAQPTRLTWIGLGALPFVADFRAGLRDAGLIEGQHFLLESLTAPGNDADRLRALAQQSLAATDIFIASGIATALAVRDAGGTIPIVGVVSEPVALGLAQSIVRPGGRFTGIAIEAIETGPKSLELLKRAFPAIGRVLLLIEPTVSGRRQRTQIDQAAKALRLELVEAQIERPEEIDAALAIARQSKVDALLVPASPLFAAQRDRLLNLGATLALPAMYEHRAFARAGGLLCHGPNIAAAFYRLGSFVERLRRGEPAANMAIEAVGRVELIVNRATARAQNLVISAEILERADEVLE